MRLKIFAGAFPVLLLASNAAADIQIYTSGAFCSDPLSSTIVRIDFEYHGHDGNRDWGTKDVDISCGNHTSEMVYVTSNAYCVVTSSGCPSGIGSVYCYKDSESNGTGFSLSCPM